VGHPRKAYKHWGYGWPTPLGHPGPLGPPQTGCLHEAPGRSRMAQAGGDLDVPGLPSASGSGRDRGAVMTPLWADRQAQRIADAVADPLLAEQLNGDPFGSASGMNDGGLDRGGGQTTTLSKSRVLPDQMHVKDQARSRWR
jgi:hypothetical protein